MRQFDAQGAVRVELRADVESTHTFMPAQNEAEDL
jgi:hypothetical protein